MQTRSRKARRGLKWPATSRFPRIRLERDGIIRSFDCDNPAARSVPTRKWIGADLIHLVTAGLAALYNIQEASSNLATRVV